MLNPNLSGYCAKSLLRIVDFPAPDGPQITIGRGPGTGGILKRVIVRVVVIVWRRLFGLGRKGIYCQQCVGYDDLGFGN